jgi:hypothetical protein
VWHVACKVECTLLCGATLLLLLLLCPAGFVLLQAATLDPGHCTMNSTPDSLWVHDWA